MKPESYSESRRKSHTAPLPETFFIKIVTIKNEYTQFKLVKDILVKYIYMVFTTEEFLEVAAESWPERDLNPQSLNSIQTL